MSGHREQVVTRKACPLGRTQVEWPEGKRLKGEGSDPLGRRVVPSCRLFSRKSREMSSQGSMA